jgi:site-specific recombinase XerD
MQNRNTLTNDRRFLVPSADLEPYLNSFTKMLSVQGYTSLSIEAYYQSIAHFSTWLQKKSIPFKKINNATVENFAKHRCHCTCLPVKNKMSRRYVNRVRYFISYLYKKKILIKKDLSKASPPLITKFIRSLHSLGLASATIRGHEISISKLLPLLGKNPKKYNSKIVQKAVYKASEQCSPAVLEKLLSTLRVYLRFLVVEGTCSSHLDAAVPTVAHWRLSTLPKYISSSEVERVISSCDTHTKQGLRDRAILLLLARLGLRAGD